MIGLFFFDNSIIVIDYSDQSKRISLFEGIKKLIPSTTNTLESVHGHMNLQDENKDEIKKDPTSQDFQNEFIGSNEEIETFQSVIKSNEFKSANTFWYSSISQKTF